MPSKRPRRPRAEIFVPRDRVDIADIEAALKALGSSQLSMRTLVAQVSAGIRTALAMGSTEEQVVELLEAKTGAKLTVSTLRAYMRGEQSGRPPRKDALRKAVAALPDPARASG